MKNRGESLTAVLFYLGMLALPRDAAAAPKVLKVWAPFGQSQSSVQKKARKPQEERGISVEDARYNFQALASSFVQSRSANGYWSLRDHRLGRVRRVKLVRVDSGRLRRLAPNRFKAPVELRELGSGAVLRPWFIVDFSGPQWRVVGMTL